METNIDALFLVDSHGDAERNWDTVIEYVQRIAGYMLFIADDTYPDTVSDRLSIVVYGDRERLTVNFNLARYDLYEDIYNAIGSLRAYGGGDNLEEALQYYPNVFTGRESDGDINDVVNVILIITDNDPASSRDEDDLVRVSEDVQDDVRYIDMTGMTDENIYDFWVRVVDNDRHIHIYDNDDWRFVEEMSYPTWYDLYPIRGGGSVEGGLH